ncbi:pyrophosphohydrolase [Candidatus Poribacteria bacterium]|nr:pyrophosphohydrolase [Candidatus Poribacteria bacterium]
MTIAEFQRRIEAAYFERDAARGVPTTFVWFTEEVGELAKEVRRQPRDTQRLTAEIADVFAWLSTLASMLGIELTDCAEVYADGCPKCGKSPCAC